MSETSKLKKDHRQWRKEGNHLPEFLKNFHDQKEVFKMIHELTRPADGQEEKVNWLDGHVYVIDTFLWCMARHGYTLQKSRAQVEFDNIDKNLELIRQRENQLLQLFFENAKNKKTPEE